MLPNFPEFSKLSLDHQKDIDEAISGFPPYSDYTFASLYPWNSQNKLELSNLNGNLVVKFTDYVTDEPFLSFLGTNNVIETVETLFEYLNAHFRHPEPSSLPVILSAVTHAKDLNSRDASVRRPQHDGVGGPLDPQNDGEKKALLSNLKLIPEDNLKGVTLPHQFLVTEDPDNFDYIYLFSKGKIVGEGTFKELKANHHFAAMWQRYNKEVESDGKAEEQSRGR